MSGGTFRLDSPNTEAVILNGTGYAGGGAFHVQRSITQAQPITVASDATMRIDSGQTVTMTAALNGSRMLTVFGGGTLDLNNTWTYPISGTNANGIILNNVGLDISGCTLSITNLGETARQYVIVDYSAAGASLTGSFAVTNGLQDGWRILQDTAKFPKQLYLERPAFGTVIMIK